MRVLIVTTVMPHHMRLGGEVVTQNFVDAIVSLGHTCDLVAYQHHGDDAPLPAGYHSAGGWHIETEHAGLRPYVWLARAVLTGEPYLCTKFHSHNMVTAVRTLLAAHRYDAVILDHTNLGWLLDHLVFDGPIMFVAHNLESGLYADEAAAFARHGRVKRAVFAREARALSRMEKRLARRCRQIWTLTTAEQTAFGQLAADPARCVRVFDVPGKALPVGNMPAQPPRIDVGLLGGWHWNVNRAGLAWFMREVVPKLPSSIGIEIAGKGAETVNNPFENVVYRGFVDSAVGFLRACRVTVVPSVAGAGVQVKTIEGISAGVPMISTPIGLRGISALPAFVASANDAQAMAGMIEARVRDPVAPDYAAGARWSKARFESFRAQIDAALAEAVVVR